MKEDEPGTPKVVLDANLREQAIYWYGVFSSRVSLSRGGQDKLADFLADVANELTTSDPVASTQGESS